jgi:broad specificity phosphatase PhoE
MRKGSPERILHFVRHGQYVDEGPDVGKLTALGRRQAARVARHFKGIRVAALRSSSMPRAMETAAIIARALGRRHVPRHAVLREVLPAKVPGVVVPRAKQQRGLHQLERIVSRFFRASVRTRHEVVVCHGNLIRALLLHVAAGSPEGFYRLVIHHASVTTFSVSRRGIKILGFNAQAHLPPKQRTFA